MQSKDTPGHRPYFFAAALGTALFLLVFLMLTFTRNIILAAMHIEIATIAQIQDCFLNAGIVFLAAYLAPLLVIGTILYEHENMGA